MTEYKSALELIKAQNTNNKNLFTGFRELEKVLCFNPKESLITIAGRPVMGKTSFLCTLALNLVELKKPVLFITVEESKDMLLKKLILQKAQIGLKTVFEKEFSKEQLQNIEQSAQEISEYLCVESILHFDTDKLYEKLTEKQFEYVLIDGIQKFCDFDLQLVKALKSIILEKSCTLFLTADVSYDLEERGDKMPKLGDIKNGFVLEEQSEAVIFLYRHNYYDFEDARFNNTELYIAKNKCGPTGFVEMHFNEDLVRFEDIPMVDPF